MKKKQWIKNMYSSLVMLVIVDIDVNESSCRENKKYGKYDLSEVQPVVRLSPCLPAVKPRYVFQHSFIDLTAKQPGDAFRRRAGDATACSANANRQPPTAQCCHTKERDEDDWSTDEYC